MPCFYVYAVVVRRECFDFFEIDSYISCTHINRMQPGGLGGCSFLTHFSLFYLEADFKVLEIYIPMAEKTPAFYISGANVFSRIPASYIRYNSATGITGSGPRNQLSAKFIRWFGNKDTLEDVLGKPEEAGRLHCPVLSTGGRRSSSPCWPRLELLANNPLLTRLKGTSGKPAFQAWLPIGSWCGPCKSSILL